jgi:ketosteroid isomerase-like protein
MAIDAVVPSVEAGAVIDKLFEALARGDVASARACCTPEARFWHSFDGVALDLDQACAGWAGFIASFSERTVVDVRRVGIPNGFLQQHYLVVRRPDGARKGWPICIVVRTREGLIARLEEYIDRSGTLPVSGGDLTTPGLPPANRVESPSS